MGRSSFFKTIPGIVSTEAGRANGTTSNLSGEYDGYAECVKLTFDPDSLTIRNIMAYLFEVIDPYSLNQQGQDIGKKYRTGLYSENMQHLKEAQTFIDEREDSDYIVVEVLPLSNYVKVRTNIKIDWKIILKIIICVIFPCIC